MATIIKAHGEAFSIEPRNNNDFSLSELQAIVSGYIEIVPLKGNDVMVVNEEGKLNGLAINHTATRIYMEANPYALDIIVGDVLICNRNQIK